MPEDRILDSVHDILVARHYSNVERVPGGCYVDVDGETYSVIVVKCETEEESGS